MNSVQELRRKLPTLKKPNYSSIDSLMRKIMKKYDVTAKELHYGFKKAHNNQTPDQYVKKMKTYEEFIYERDELEEAAPLVALAPKLMAVAARVGPALKKYGPAIKKHAPTVLRTLGSNDGEVSNLDKTLRKKSEQLAGDAAERRGRETVKNLPIIGGIAGGISRRAGEAAGGQLYDKVTGPIRKLVAADYSYEDLILNYLLDEGYADCLGSAELIAENMSEAWAQEILEQYNY